MIESTNVMLTVLQESPSMSEALQYFLSKSLLAQWQRSSFLFFILFLLWGLINQSPTKFLTYSIYL